MFQPFPFLSVMLVGMVFIQIARAKTVIVNGLIMDLDGRKSRMGDAYWNAKDEFEHDIKELFGQFISPEEFEKKWRPRLHSEFKEKDDVS